ncbi:hypothetical protein LB572_31755 [Mesorhizobium sp. BH1-1-5]|uniref:hypothetical protein n=1 Tax=Mesorhizobium sp. BH1-1-5 TaxID=2876661 RepID=UPI001CCEBEA6|nr:hypothetical protein [Mesorhizobium sp. BH1-1-5]MBZ9991676.1 hypothetical protein [Mesorhizobium sp. BH1-1-5]
MRGWIRQQRFADAEAPRKNIARLEEELIAARPDKRAKLHEIGVQLRAHKSRLEQLQRCILPIGGKKIKGPARFNALALYNLPVLAASVRSRSSKSGR